MRDASHADEFRRIVDDVHDAPITHPYSPQIFVASQLFASGRSRMDREQFQFFNYAVQENIRQGIKFFAC